MRKLIILAAFALTFSSAQAQRNEEDRAKMRSEMIGKVADRLAKNFELKDDAKADFITTYTEYQNEMFATNAQRPRPEANENEKKELSDAEATAKIQEQFAHQEQQIAQMQKRLEIQKKYYEKFAKTLTPQQLVKVFAQPQRQQGQRGEQGQRFNGEGGPRGGFGGGPRGGFGGPGGFGGGF